MPDTLREDLREIGPQLVLYTSRMWEGLTRTIQTRIRDSGPFKRALYNIFLTLNHKIRQIERRGMATWWHQLLHLLSNFVVLRALKDKIGLLKVRVCYTGGSITSQDVFRFLEAIGLKIKQVYGASEAPLIALHRTGDVDIETVGPPLPGYEIKITDHGELVLKGEGVFFGYYKDQEATSKVIEEGWYHTGDACRLDAKGHIVYIDRFSDLMELPDGKKSSPQYIESKLKFSPYIQEVFIIVSRMCGNEELFLAAIVQIDFANTSRWAEQRHIKYTTYNDLSQKPEVSELINIEISRINRTLPKAEKVRKFVLLNKEFDPDEGELTRTRKLKRNFIEKKYRQIVDAIYSGIEEFSVQTEVKYQDGRIGWMTTSIRIWNTKEENL
jgi:long-chain acyl-CoA synthetase